MSFWIDMIALLMITALSGVLGATTTQSCACWTTEYFDILPSPTSFARSCEDVGDGGSIDDYDVQCNSNLGTSDLYYLDSQTFTGCLDLCDKIPGCVGWSYRKDIGRCYYKSATGTPEANPLYDVAQLLAPKTPGNQQTCQLLEGDKVRSGLTIFCGAQLLGDTDIGIPQFAYSFQECVDRCGATTDCVGVSFDRARNVLDEPGPGVCSMKGGNVLKTAMTTSDVAVKLPYGITNLGPCYPYSETEPGLTFAGFISTNEMSQSKCAAYCYGQGHRYSGVANGKECRCGDDLPGFSKSDIAKCYTPCPGKNAETCGGPNHLGMTAVANVVQPLRGSWRPQGTCYKDPLNARRGWFYGILANNTRKLCGELCRETGQLVSYVEYGDHCFCGPARGGYKDTSGCNFPCPGDPSGTCGGEDVLQYGHLY